MPTKPKYTYDIYIIEHLVNTGYSIRQIAKKMKWPPGSTQRWLNRNYTRVVSYIKKK